MDRAVLITGASQGIKAAVARRFAREGWRVGVNYRTSVAGRRPWQQRSPPPGDRPPSCPAMSDPAQAAALVRAAEEQLGPLDALVCNAGVALPQQLLTDTTDEQWRQVMGVDLDGVFYTLRAAVPGFVRRQRGPSSPYPPCGGHWRLLRGGLFRREGGGHRPDQGAGQAGALPTSPSTAWPPGSSTREMNGDWIARPWPLWRRRPPGPDRHGGRGGGERVVPGRGGAPFLTGQVIQPNGGIVI